LEVLLIIEKLDKIYQKIGENGLLAWASAAGGRGPHGFSNMVQIM